MLRLWAEALREVLQVALVGPIRFANLQECLPHPMLWLLSGNFALRGGFFRVPVMLLKMRPPPVKVAVWLQAQVVRACCRPPAVAGARLF